MWMQLMQSVRAGLAADGFLSGLLTGGFWLYQAPDGQAMPYLTISPSLTAAADRSTGQNQMDTFGVQCQVWSTDPELVSRVLQRIEGWMLDWNGDSAATVRNKTKIGGDMFAEPDRDADNNLIYQGVLGMEVQVEWNPRILV